MRAASLRRPPDFVRVCLKRTCCPQARGAVRFDHTYVPTELVMLLGQAGFEVEHVWGGAAGNWGRRKIHLDEMEMMVVARKADNVT